VGDSELTTHRLDVPGGRLHYEVCGAGPVLVLIGAPMDARGFIALASHLTRDFTSVAYDPRGISRRPAMTPPRTPRRKCWPMTRTTCSQPSGPSRLTSLVAAAAPSSGSPWSLGTLTRCVH